MVVDTTAVHFEIIRGLLTTGACPSNTLLAGTLGCDAAALETTLRRLSDIHGVVLHPHVCEPWVIHPFSLTPTANWIQSSRGGWWAPCLWCAFGVATLAAGYVVIHARLGGQSESIQIFVRDGVPLTHSELLVHFAIPPKDAWRNVHEHCSLVLPFRSEAAIDAWSARHRLPRGEAVPLHQTAALARAWYGTHANPDWHKWSIAEAQQIFRAAGLTSNFWDLGVQSGNF